ncbi:hypothetical protein [Actinokineospora sp. HUAS TT18]
MRKPAFLGALLAAAALVVATLIGTSAEGAPDQTGDVTAATAPCFC